MTMRSPKLFTQMMTSGIAFAILASQWQPEIRTGRRAECSARVEIENYEVSGRNDEEIRALLRAAGPRDARGQARDGYTKWRLRWLWKTSASKFVDADTVRVRLDARITIPRCAQCGARWNEFRLRLIRHELRHLEYALNGARQLADDLDTAASSAPLSGSAAQALGDRAVNKIRAADRAYDQSTDHGRSEGIRW